MIRSLGSSLLAKAGTGSLTRKKEESRILRPEIPGKAAVGTAIRDLTQETNITPVAPGSEKVIRSAPGIESASTPGMATNQVPLVAGMGMPIGATPGGAMMGGNNQALFQGGVSTPAAVPGQAGRQAMAVSAPGRGGVAAARVAQATQAAQTVTEPGRISPEGGAQTTYQVEPLKRFVINAFLKGILPAIRRTGGRTQAEDPGESMEISPTAGQVLSNIASRTINTVGGALGNPLRERGISEGLMALAKNPAATLKGQGSIAKTVQNIGSGLRSVTQSAQNTWNKLRSKFGR